MKPSLMPKGNLHNLTHTTILRRPDGGITDYPLANGVSGLAFL